MVRESSSEEVTLGEDREMRHQQGQGEHELQASRWAQACEWVSTRCMGNLYEACGWSEVGKGHSCRNEAGEVVGLPG